MLVRRGPPRRVLGAFAASLAMHACVVAVLVASSSATPPRRVKPPLQLTQVRWIDVATPAAEKPPTAKRDAVVAKPLVGARDSLGAQTSPPATPPKRDSLAAQTSAPATLGARDSLAAQPSATVAPPPGEYDALAAQTSTTAASPPSSLAAQTSPPPGGLNSRAAETSATAAPPSSLAAQTSPPPGGLDSLAAQPSATAPPPGGLGSLAAQPSATAAQPPGGHDALAAQPSATTSPAAPTPPPARRDSLPPDTTSSSAPDAPRSSPATLAPTTARGDVPGVIDRPRGVTLHPGDLPSDEELLADEQARVEARLGGWLRSGLARARAQNGLPDPAYGVLGHQLRAATADVPAFIDTNSAKEVATAFKDTWLAGAERYGKTGAPYAEPEGRLESIERPSALADAMARGSPDALALGSFLSAGARLQEFADGRAGLELYALVEIRQDALGAVEHVELVRPSGLRPFDAWVTERAGGIVVTLGFDAGTRDRALRSVWRFDGILKFRRKLKVTELDGRAALGMVTMSVLSALSGLGNANGAPRFPGMLGRFDELTGEMDVVDLTNPTYDCKVSLVEAD